MEVETKLTELDSLLEKTSVYSQFLVGRLQERSDVAQTKKRRRKSEQAEKQDKINSVVSHAQADNFDVRRTATQNRSFAQPKLVSGAKLRDYQLAGVEWMVSLYENGINGILADEMGLGKTLQTISFFCYLRQRGVMGPFLVIAPKSVLKTWESEFSKFAPSVPCLIYYGLPKERKTIGKSLQRRIDASCPVVCTTYEMVIRDRSVLARVPWKYIVVDEAQRIKNFECRLVKELKKYSSANRLLITGTPLQNDLSELWSLLNFLLPEVFDDLSAFESWFEFGTRGKENVGLDALEQEKKDQLVTKLHSIMRPFLLRRLKIDVEQVLPPKKEIVVYTPMTSLQKKYYDAARENRLHEILSSSGRKAGSQNLQHRLMQMRKACAHPFLFEETDENGVVGEELATTERLVQVGSKMSVMDRLIAKLVKRGHKILIFSQFTRILDIIEDVMHLRKYEYVRLDGSTSLENRTTYMDSFNDERSKTRIFLISTRAGGLGVTLTAADTVIFYDSDYNPQVDLQAMDRCHRIGQSRPVHVYRLITSGTVEEALLKRAMEKRKLEHIVVAKGNFQRPAEAEPDEIVESGDLEGIIRYNPISDEIGYKQKSITDEELDQIISLRPEYASSTERSISKISDDGSDTLEGDGFELYNISPTTNIFASR